MSRSITLSQNGYGEHLLYPYHSLEDNIWIIIIKNIKAGGTQGCSQTVPQSSTDRALRRLTSEFGRDPVYSTRYGRQRLYPQTHHTAKHLTKHKTTKQKRTHTQRSFATNRNQASSGATHTRNTNQSPETTINSFKFHPCDLLPPELKGIDGPEHQPIQSPEITNRGFKPPKR